MFDLESEWAVPCCWPQLFPKGPVSLQANEPRVNRTTWPTQSLFVRVTNWSSFLGTQVVHGMQEFQFENCDSPRQTRMSWSLYCLFKYIFSVSGITPGINQKQREPYTQPSPYCQAPFPNLIDQALLFNIRPEGRIQSETHWARHLPIAF